MRISSILFSSVILLLVSGCGGKPVATTPLPSNPNITENQLNSYPVPPYPLEDSSSSSKSNNSYPVSTLSGQDKIVPSPTPDPSVSPIIISKVMHNDSNLETIVITNVTGEPQNISGYSLLIAETSEHINFPEIALPPQDSYNVYNGPEAKTQSDGLVWLDHVALKVNGDSILLLNRAGRMIWNYTMLLNNP
jgi:hypothetical protein